MKIVKQTKFEVAPLAGRVNFPGHSLTLVVKGTFDLQHGGPVAPAGEQLSPTGDEFFPGDEERTGSLRYDSDFAFHKLRADVLLVGSCHAPNGQPVVSCPATFRVGEKSKTVIVLGNRRWERLPFQWQATEPKPFTKLELRYENSFGGEKFAANPTGKGLVEKPDEAGGQTWPLPNLEDPGRLVAGPGDRPAPAGFGPLNRNWELRHGKLGTYKGAYQKTRWPWFPEDFDFTYFNAAPPDQQLEGYLRGDEPLVFENLHPRHARYESQLPGLRVRCFLNRLTEASATDLRFDEVQMRLDTLWVDMDAAKLVLVWRGWAPVSSEEHKEIKHWFIIAEPLAQTPAPLELYHRQFLQLQAAEEKPFEPEAPPPIPPEPPGPSNVPDPAAAAALAAALEKQKAETKKKLEAQTAALNAQMGFDKLPPEIQQKTREAQAKLIEKLAENDPAKSAQLEHAAQMEHLHGALGKLGIDPNNLPTLTDKARAEQARLINELGLSTAEIKGDPRMAELTTLLGAVLTKAAKDPENLETLIAEVRKQKAKLGLTEEEAPAPPTPPTQPPLTRESIQASVANHESFAGADLRGLDLSGLDLNGADFTAANLSGVPLRKTRLKQANFTRANLANADLTEAELANVNAAGANFSKARMRQTILKSADLAGANLAKADLTKAVLDEAILEGAILTEAALAAASAVGANFARADLASANFQNGVAVKADFTKAILSGANFQEADLTEGCVNGATGRQCNLTGANLTKLRAGGGCDFSGASMVAARGDGSMWKGANLTGADLRYARMEAAMFTSACLKQSNLSAANLKFGRFNQANLTQAKLVRMNLFQGNLEKADLTGTDFTGSNLYEADFLDAVLPGAILDGANLRMTKLEHL